MRADVKAAWDEATAGRPGAAAAWGEIERAYAAPGRHYHTLDHLAYVLGTAERQGPALAGEDRRVFVFALAFHDAVYEPLRRDNEVRSADLAGRVLAGLGEPPALIARVQRWIAATHGHPRSGEPALDLFLDCDLAIFAAALDEYETYGEAVRREFVGAGMSDTEFHAGRIAFLARMLERNPFYLTRALRPLDSTAHDNIRDEIRRLSPTAEI